MMRRRHLYIYLQTQLCSMGMMQLLVAERWYGHQIWTAVANVSNKQYMIGDKGWSSSLWAEINMYMIMMMIMNIIMMF
jgi:hypothetical protein